MRGAFLAAALLLVSSALAAEPIIVPGPEKSPARATVPAAFISAVRARGEAGAPLPLIAPPAWGRTVPDASGTVRLHPTVANGLVLQVALKGLLPAHRYILTLNGNPKLPGNDLLPDPVPGLPAERYYDFQTATTDDHGAYAATFGIVLPAGDYQVRFYVKDTADFKIVLYHDYFPCAVN